MLIESSKRPTKLKCTSQHIKILPITLLLHEFLFFQEPNIRKRIQKAKYMAIKFFIIEYSFGHKSSYVPVINGPFLTKLLN